MSEALDIDQPPPKQPKQNLPDLNFVDFVPIDNNADNFDLGELINAVAKDDLKTDEQDKPNSDQLITPSPLKTKCKWPYQRCFCSSNTA